MWEPPEFVSDRDTRDGGLGVQPAPGDAFLDDETGRTRSELEAVQLQLRSTTEQLETTNQLLDMTNDELRQTNAELDSMNHELEATNEEFAVINGELYRRTDELNDLNSLLAALVGSLDRPVVVVDGQARVRVWNQRATELWGLADDGGDAEHFATLDAALPVEQLRRPVRACLAGQEGVDIDLDATDVRGRPVRGRVEVRPLRSFDGSIVGAVVMASPVGAPPT